MQSLESYIHNSLTYEIMRRTNAYSNMGLED